jgi:hypothetical protein
VRMNDSPHIQPGQLFPSDRLILAYLARLARWYPVVYASVDTIATRCNLSGRTVQRSLPRLVTAGQIQIEPDATNPTGRRFVLLTGQPAQELDRLAPVACHPKQTGDFVSPNVPHSVRNRKESSERQPQAQAGQPRLTTNSLPEPDRQILDWFLERRIRAHRIGNPGAYRHTLTRQWSTAGIPLDIATAYAAWERARASRIAQERAREADQAKRRLTGPEPPQPELGAMIRAILPARYKGEIKRGAGTPESPALQADTSPCDMPESQQSNGNQNGN